ncbi:MAG: epoxyqueuosine reductase QueH [Syntrophales bacterium]
MRLLLHICCAPCTICPLRVLRSREADVTGYFFNPNIHPFMEYRKRSETLRDYAEQAGLKVIWHEPYEMETYLRAVVYHEKDRCRICYHMRLSRTARLAADEGFNAFSSTLLYSKYQKHDLIRTVGEQLGREHNISFLYDDFRAGWQEGVSASREMGLYRQPYCGCIYSEQERYNTIGALKRR